MCVNFTRLCWLVPSYHFHNEIPHWNTRWRRPFIHQVDSEQYRRNRVQKITDFAIKMSNSDHETSESESNKSFATSSTTFSAERAVVLQKAQNQRLIVTTVIYWCKFSQFFRIILEKSHIFYKFPSNWNPNFFLQILWNFTVFCIAGKLYP